MATAHWLAALDGNWNLGANWATGLVPGTADDVFIDATGFDYQVSLTAPAAVHSLTIDSPNATFAQSASAPLTLALDLVVDAGTVVLRAANTIGGSVTNVDGVIRFSSSAAFGSAAINNAGSGTIESIADATLANSIAESGQGTFAAAHGTTLHLTGGFSVDAGSSLQFGTVFAPGTNGIVDFAPLGMSVGAGTTVFLNEGTLRVGNSNVNALLSSVAQFYLNPDGVLDVNGQAIEIANLYGGGAVVNSGGAGSLKLDGGTLYGTISGPLSVEIAGTTTFAARSTYAGTTTIDPAGTLQLGDGNHVGAIKGAIVDNGTLEIDSPSSITILNPISGTGTLFLFNPQSIDVVTINQANSFTGGSDLFNGTVAIGNAAALGSGTVQMEFGKLEGTKNETLTNVLDLKDDPSLSAAHGTTVTFDTHWTLADDTQLIFGADGQDGTVVAKFESLTQGSATRFFFAAGTVQAADNELGGMLQSGERTIIDAGATIDAAGFFLGFTNLSGSGTITNSGAAREVDIASGAFAGKITGAEEAVFSGGTILTGTNTYTGGTIINAGGVLSLGNGGTAGSIKGGIHDEGILQIDRSNAVTLAQTISGGGELIQRGGGTTTLNVANAYSGGTVIADGTLVGGHVGALGSGAVSLEGGQLLSTVTGKIHNELGFAGHSTIAAAAGKTLTLDGAWDIAQNAVLTFGAAGETGMVVAKAALGGSFTTPFSIDVATGTLEMGTANAAFILNSTATTTVESGATLDLAGFQGFLAQLGGGGVIRSTPAATLIVVDGNFSGAINGGVSLHVSHAVTLSGGGSFDNATIEASAHLRLVNTAHENVLFAGTGATLVLATPASFSGTVEGMIQSDRLDFTTIAFGTGTHRTFDATTDVLTVTDGTHTATVQFQDGYHQSDFGLANDGHGHTFVTTTVTSAPMSALPDADALI